MAVKTKTGVWGSVELESTPKKTIQGRGKHTKYSATSRNKAKKRIEVKENKKNRPKGRFFVSNIKFYISCLNKKRK